MTYGRHTSYAPKPRRRWPWVILAFGILLTIFSFSTNGGAAIDTSTPDFTTSGPASVASVPTTSAQAPQDIRVDLFTQGTWDVGTETGEIGPGRYRTTGSESIFPLCTAQREKLNGEPIGFPEMTNEGPATITVRESDGQVTFSGDCEWAKVTSG